MSFSLKSGVTDQYVYFEGPPGLSSFTVYGAKNGAAAAAFTTPTVAEVDASNAPGLYSLLLDEQTSVAGGNLTEQLALHISATGWAGTTVFVNLFNDALFSVGLTGTPSVNTTQVAGTAITGSGTAGDPWGP